MPAVTVLGLGNILMQDEGVGVRLMEAVRGAGDWPDEVRFVDGGAGGLNLLGIIEEADRLVVFDAGRMGLPPGSHRVVRPEQIADESDRGRYSLHDVSFLETLRLCEQFTRRPDDVTLFVVQPAVVDYGRELTEPICRAWATLTKAAVEVVRQRLHEAPGR